MTMTGGDPTGPRAPWFTTVRTRFADPVLDRRLRGFFRDRPAPSEAQLRGVVFDLVTGATSAAGAIRDLPLDADTRGALRAELERPPDRPEIRAALEAAGRLEEAAALDDTPLEGGEFESGAPRRTGVRAWSTSAGSGAEPTPTSPAGPATPRVPTPGDASPPPPTRTASTPDPAVATTAPSFPAPRDASGAAPAPRDASGAAPRAPAPLDAPAAAPRPSVPPDAPAAAPRAPAPLDASATTPRPSAPSDAPAPTHPGAPVTGSGRGIEDALHALDLRTARLEAKLDHAVSLLRVAAFAGALALFALVLVALLA